VKPLIQAAVACRAILVFEGRLLVLIFLCFMADYFGDFTLDFDIQLGNGSGLLTERVQGSAIEQRSVVKASQESEIDQGQEKEEGETEKQ